MRRLSAIVVLALLPVVVAAQVDEGALWGVGMNSRQMPAPYPFLRESDVVWSTCLWKTVDMHESFNQYMYFPIDTFRCDERKSLAYVIWDGVVSGEIPIYEDDELKIPLDNDVFVQQYTKADTVRLEIGYDDDDNELYEYSIRPRDFDGADFLWYSLREVWFIGKADTRLDSRRIALAPMKNTYRKFGDDEEGIYLGRMPVFWIPMQNPAVRTFLSRRTAYIDDFNSALQPSWDYIFVAQRYNAYVTRESNRYLREVSKYLTGIDAILEAEAIEEKVFEIGDDMWEY